MTFPLPPPVLPSTTSSQAPHSPDPTPSPDGPALITPGVARHPVAATAVAITAVTVLAALAGAGDPYLGPGGHPHPTLHGSPSEALDIFTTNARLLAVPLLLTAGRWATGRVTRRLGDVIVALLLIANPATVGLAAGRFQGALLPYLPHLPLEDAALAVAAAAWLSHRLPDDAGRPRPGLPCYAAVTFALTVAAALTETYLVPHAR